MTFNAAGFERGANRSLPPQSPWPDVDEGWSRAVFTDRRLKRDFVADQRFGQLPVRSLTFECKWCGQHRTVKVDDSTGTFGRDRSVQSSGGLYSTAGISACAGKARNARSLVGPESVFGKHRASYYSPLARHSGRQHGKSGQYPSTVTQQAFLVQLWCFICC